MYQRTKRDYLLMRMVNSFEDQQANGLIGYWEEEDLNALIAHYESESKIDKAMDVVNLGLKRFPFQFEYFLIKARLLLYSSQTELALKVLDDAQNVAPSEPEIRLLRGEILCAGEAYDLALEIFEDVKGDVFGEELCRVLIRESYIHESMKDFASMFYTLKQALEIDPNNNEALEQIWMSVELSKKYDESITLHTALIDKNPYSYLAWFNLGHAYSCLGEYEKAIDALEYAFIINPDFEAAYMDCAEICFQEKKYEKAFKIYEEVNELFGPDAETLVFMVECLIPLNEYEKAMSLLLMSLTIDPYNDEVHFYLGECHASMGNWKDAIKAYNKAIKIEDRREEYNSSLANAYEQVGEIKLANHYHKKATHIASEQNLYWIKHALFAKRCIGVEAALDILNKADLFAVGSDLM
jgi:tetratricopeptide (TPR) repeat protein